MIQMKLILGLSLIFLTATGIASNDLVLAQYGGASSGVIVERAKGCSNKLDQRVLDAAEQKGLKLNKEILNLCANKQTKHGAKFSNGLFS